MLLRNYITKFIYLKLLKIKLIIYKPTFLIGILKKNIISIHLVYEGENIYKILKMTSIIMYEGEEING